MLAPVQVAPGAYDRILALITAEENEEDLQIVVKERAEYLKDVLLMMLDDGIFPIWSKNKNAQARHAEYMKNTYPEDLTAALDPDFLKKRNRGDPDYQYQLRVEQLIMARQQYEQQAQAMPPPELAKINPFWALIGQTIPEVWAKLSRDFLSLHKRYGAEQDELIIPPDDELIIPDDDWRPSYQ